MKYKFALCISIAAAIAFSQNLDKIPSWAYGTVPAEPKASPKPPDTEKHHIANNDLSFTLSEIRNPFGPADWFPSDHPTMPPVVANGSKPNVLPARSVIIQMEKDALKTQAFPVCRLNTSYKR